MADLTAPSGPDRFAPKDPTNVARLGGHWSGSRLFIALSTMFFSAGGFAYFYLRSLNNNGLWRAKGQSPSPFVAVPVLVMTLVAVALYWWATRRLLLDRKTVNDWRVAAAVAALLMLFAAGIQLWGMHRLGFFPGSSGYASVYAAVQPLFAVWLLLGFYWIEVLLARSLRRRWIVAPVAGNEEAPDAISFSGALEGSKAFAIFLGLLAIVLYILFSVLK